jgi:uncharacterized protein YggU (UPF0235/DUF167 family)
VALVRVYCGLASADRAAPAVDADGWLTAAVVDDAGRLLDVCEISDNPAGYARLCTVLAERSGGPTAVAIAADSDDHRLTMLLSAAGRALAIADDDAVDDYAERFADDESADEMHSPPAERRAVGLARALQAGALSAIALPTSRDLAGLKGVLVAHAALVTGRHSAAVALREVLRELHPAALRAYPDPAEPVPLAVLDALPEPYSLSAGTSGRNRDSATTEAVVSDLASSGVADAATIKEAITALRVAIAETPRRGAAHKASSAAIAETIRQAVAAVRACDAACEALVSSLAERTKAPASGLGIAAGEAGRRSREQAAPATRSRAGHRAATPEPEHAAPERSRAEVPTGRRAAREPVVETAPPTGRRSRSQTAAEGAPAAARPAARTPALPPPVAPAAAGPGYAASPLDPLAPLAPAASAAPAGAPLPGAPLPGAPLPGAPARSRPPYGAPAGPPPPLGMPAGPPPHGAPAGPPPHGMPAGPPPLGMPAGPPPHGAPAGPPPAAPVSPPAWVTGTGSNRPVSVPPPPPPGITPIVPGQRPTLPAADAGEPFRPTLTPPAPPAPVSSRATRAAEGRQSVAAAVESRSEALRAIRRRSVDSTQERDSGSRQGASTAPTRQSVAAAVEGRSTARAGRRSAEPADAERWADEPAPAARYSATDYTVPVPTPRPEQAAPGSRGNWPLVSSSEDRDGDVVATPGIGAQGYQSEVDVPAANLGMPSELDGPGARPERAGSLAGGRVTPPWQADDLPPEPPALRLVEPPPLADRALREDRASGARDITGDLGPAGLSIDILASNPEHGLEQPALRLVGTESLGNSNRNGNGEWAAATNGKRGGGTRRAVAESPAADQADGDLLIFAEARSAWFVGHGEEEPADWDSIADFGWQAAAERAARPAVGAETTAGLPKRVPQANLLPGSPLSSPDRPLRIVRDAASIAAHTSGYFRGWRRGQEINGYAVGGRPGRESAEGWDFTRDTGTRY